MSDKKSVDSAFEPDLQHLPFPPTGEDYAAARKAAEVPGAEKKAPEKPRYSDHYTPDPASPDPSQTQPGATDIRRPGAVLKEGETVEALSPDVKLSYKEPGDFS